MDPLHLEGQFRHHVVDEGDGGLLVAAGVGPQHPQSGAVVDGGELVVLAPPAGLAEGFDEFHIHLQLWPGRCFSYRFHRKARRW